MKEQINTPKSSFFKKIFIKMCRLFGYELIDQSSFFVPTQNKFLNENLSAQGEKSITLPLGEIKISRKVNALTVIFRSCTEVNMLTQTKKRLFDKDKSEYTLRSLNSLIKSIDLAKKKFSQIEFNLIVIDYISKKNYIDKIKKLLGDSNIKNQFISLNINEFKSSIKKVNAKNNQLSINQMSNMCNIYKSFLMAKEECKDLTYFVEDDYLHQKETISEMILTYERISSQINRDFVLCPADYPFLYTKLDTTNIFLGSDRHWRVVEETLCTFLTSKNILDKHWSTFISMCEFEHYPFEKPLHEIYKLEYCLSPIPSLAIHCTNINSIFGLSPHINWKKIWDDNKVS